MIGTLVPFPQYSCMMVEKAIESSQALAGGSIGIIIRWDKGIFSSKIFTVVYNKQRALVILSEQKTNEERGLKATYPK